MAVQKNRLQFSTRILAPRDRVWDEMLSPDSYTRWTSAFMEGSHYEGSWDKGSRIRFLGPGGGGGMVAVIEDNRRHEFISIKHIGIVKDGVDDTESDEAKAWAPAFENYHFVDRGSAGTELKVEMDVTPEFEAYMKEAWPKALAKLKEQCEG